MPAKAFASSLPEAPFGAGLQGTSRWSPCRGRPVSSYWELRVQRPREAQDGHWHRTGTRHCLGQRVLGSEGKDRPEEAGELGSARPQGTASVRLHLHVARSSGFLPHSEGSVASPWTESHDPLSHALWALGKFPLDSEVAAQACGAAEPRESCAREENCELEGQRSGLDSALHTGDGVAKRHAPVCAPCGAGMA